MPKRRASAPGHRPFERPIAPGVALLAPVAAAVFQELGVSVAVWTKRGDLPEEWYPIHVAPNVVAFEVDQSAAPPRYPYNYRCFARVLRTRQAVLGTHAGFQDFFLPIGDSSELRRVLVAGPFLTSRPTSTDILSRWHGLTQSRGRLTDPLFAQYVTATLATLTLEGSLLRAFERLLTSFGGLVSGVGDPGERAARANAMRLQLFEARACESMWELARSFVDEWRTRTIPATSAELLAYFGVRHTPEHVLVGSLLPLDDGADALDLLLRCHAFQREAVAIARDVGNTLAGQAGDQGVFFAAHFGGSRSRVRVRLGELGAHAAARARRFGLRLHVGIRLAGNDTLPERYRAALASANRAAAQGRSIVVDEPSAPLDERMLPKLRYSLGQGLEAHPELVGPRFEHYAAAAAAQSGERMDSLGRELDAGLESLTEPLLAVGALDERSFADLKKTLSAARARARTPAALIAPYRRIIDDIQRSIQQPGAARHDRGTRRAIAFMREHPGQPLRLGEVARVAGFAPGYFSKLFKKTEGITFQQYALALRVDRASEMLASSKLSIDRVRRLSGFSNRCFFNRAFKREKGISPSEFRRLSVSKQRRDAGYEPGHREAAPGSVRAGSSGRPRPTPS